MKVKTKTDEEMWAFARTLGRQLRPREKGATILALSGDLGAGKTTFTQGIAMALGIQENVVSPTFVLMRQYRIPAERKLAWNQLVHIDAYRLGSDKDLAALRFEEFSQNAMNIIVIEWPERIEAAIPKDSIRITFEIGDKSERIIQIDYKFI